MASVTVTLPSSGFISGFGWFGLSLTIPAALMDGDSDGTLASVTNRSGGRNHLVLQSIDGELSDAVIENDAAFTFVDANGGTIVVPGPNASASTSQDETQPYTWLTPSGSRFDNVFSDLLTSRDIQLTIDDGIGALGGTVTGGGAATVAGTLKVAQSVELGGSAQGGADGAVSGTLAVTQPAPVNLRGRRVRTGGRATVAGTLQVGMLLLLSGTAATGGGAATVAATLTVTPPAPVDLEGEAVTGGADAAARGALTVAARVLLSGAVRGGEDAAVAGIAVVVAVSRAIAADVEHSWELVAAVGATSFDGDAAAASHAWALRRPYTTATVRVAAVHVLEVDWDGDGSFSHALSDVTSDLLPGSLHAFRGRDYAGQAVGRSVAGTLNALLRNDHRRYSETLAGRIVRSPKIRWTVDGEPFWAGYLDDPRTKFPRSRMDIIELKALGVFSRMQTPVHISSRTGIEVVTAAGHVCDALGVPASERVLQGPYEMSRWWVNGELGLEALHQLEETERGFLSEDKQGRVWLAGRDYRITGGARTSAVTFSDTLLPGSIPIVDRPNVGQSQRDVYSVVEVPVRTFAISEVIVLWTIAQAVTVPARDSITIVASHPGPNAPANHIAVASWSPLVAGTDYTAQTGLTLRTEDLGDRLNITMANATGNDIDVATLQARGRALQEADPLIVRAQDDDAYNLYGPKEYPLQDAFFANANDAQGWAEFRLSIHSQPHQVIDIEVLANGYEDTLMALDLSRRVTLELRGADTDYFIEGIGGHLAPGDRFIVTYRLAPAGVYADIIVLDQGPPLGVGVLG